jgi:hypothetical protein
VGIGASRIETRLGAAKVNRLPAVYSKRARTAGLGILITALLFPLITALRYGGLLEEIRVNPMLAYAALGCCVMHVTASHGSRPRLLRWELPATALLAGLIRVAYYAVFNPGPETWTSWGVFLGLASIGVLTVHAARKRGNWRDVAVAGVFIYYWVVLGIALRLTCILAPRTYDQYLYAFDGTLGFQPSFLMARAISPYPLLKLAVGAIYLGVALAIAILWATQRRKQYNLGLELFPLLVLASTVGYGLYFALPAAGPVYEFQGVFPWGNPAVAPVVGAILPLLERAARNAMPSLHFGSALLLWWHSRIWPWWGRVIAALFLVGTLIATLGFGQHYLVDLIVACPVMLAVHAGGMTSVKWETRRWPVAIGAGMTGAWLTLLRLGAPAFAHWRPAVSWALCVGTVALCLKLEARLWAAARRSSHTPMPDPLPPPPVLSAPHPCPRQALSTVRVFGASERPTSD